MSATHLPESLCRRILFCTDFSKSADFAFDFAIDVALRRPGCRLCLLHVIPEPDAQFWKTYLYEIEDIDEKAKRDIDEKIAASYLSRVPEGVNLEVEFRIGRDYAKILEFAEEKQVDLIILGRRGHGAIPKFISGHVAERVAGKADCPVLVVPLSFADRPRGEGQTDPASD